MDKAIVIVGANASGKSSLAVELARKYGGEIISADSRHVYRGLDIATGKVTKREMGGVPHHLLDVASPKRTFTAADFARLGRTALTEITARGKTPFIVGGTGFYIDALIGRVSLPHAPPNPALRTQLEKKTAPQLFAQLKRRDAARARDLERKGEHTLKRRLIRALEIAHSPSAASPMDMDRPPLRKLDVLWIGLHLEDEVLKARIHARTLARMKRGMVAEARRLHERGLSWKRMEELGLEYKHLADYLRGRIGKDELIARIERDDWRYAKRQRTWFKRNSEIKWFAPSEHSKIARTVRAFLT